MQNERIYLDHAATTPITEAARAAFMLGMEQWANPSSPHHDGRAARATLEDARRRIAAALEWDGEVILTSGASEAIAIAMSRNKARNWLVSPVEHDAVLRQAKAARELQAGGDSKRNVQGLAVDLDGRLVLSGLSKLLEAAPARTLVVVQSVNNETGVIQDSDAINAAVSEAKAIWFADCSQSAGKLPLPKADLIAISAHKLGGPPGVGALLVRDLDLIEASGGQEKGYRSGTENVPATLGFAAALEASKSWHERARDLRHQLDAAIVAAGGAIVSANAPRLPMIGGYHMPGVSANAQLIQFDLAGISVSAGSACSSGTLKSSHVLSAMGWDDEAAAQVVRVSFGPSTSRAHIYRFIEQWQAIFSKAKQS
jgi:cysteine desulfurase